MTKHLARVVLLTFIVTFMCARILVFLIMTRRAPDLFLHVGGTHIHHLNYGIFLLSAVGTFLLFAPPVAKGRELAACVYGVGPALTFDEFGMWVHLGGGYWQRASFDAIVVVASTLALIGYCPWTYAARVRTWWVAAGVLILLVGFSFLFVESFRFVENGIGPKLDRLEKEGPK